MSEYLKKQAEDDAAALAITNLSKRYPGGLLANDRVDLRIGRGEVLGLLGPNGAGKTTLVKQIIGLLKPTSGSIVLDGHDLVADPALARRLCAYLPQGALPLSSFRPSEVVDLVGRIRGGDRRSVRRRAAELLEALELDDWTGTFGARLSGGVKRLVGFVMTAVWPVSLVILDEPTNDVDPLRRRLLWKQVRRLASEGSTVLLVTHNVLEAEQAVDRLAVMDHGRIIAEGSPASLRARSRHRLRLQLDLPPGADSPELPALVRDHVRLGRRLHLAIDEPDAVEAIHWARSLAEDGRAEEYALGGSTLEDVYIRLIGREDALELADRGGVDS
jgi:ABC-2 type transport system ATP-binding protein